MLIIPVQRIASLATIDQTPLFILGLGFSFHNSYLYFESVSSPVQVAYTLSSYAALWYYNEHATSQS